MGFKRNIEKQTNGILKESIKKIFGCTKERMVNGESIQTMN
jgi:hypothetical protein